MKLKLSKTFRTIAIRDESAAMTVICNIQTMQKVIYGSASEYRVFSSNTVDELHDIQNELIPEYNEAIKKPKA